MNTFSVQESRDCYLLTIEACNWTVVACFWSLVTTTESLLHCVVEGTEEFETAAAIDDFIDC